MPTRCFNLSTYFGLQHCGAWKERMNETLFKGDAPQTMRAGFSLIIFRRLSRSLWSSTGVYSGRYMYRGNIPERSIAREQKITWRVTDTLTISCEQNRAPNVLCGNVYFCAFYVAFRFPQRPMIRKTATHMSRITFDCRRLFCSALIFTFPLPRSLLFYSLKFIEGKQNGNKRLYFASFKRRCTSFPDKALSNELICTE